MKAASLISTGTALLALSLLIPMPAFGQGLGQGRGRNVVNTPHNLSAAGPGVIRAATEEEVCIFCHSTHIASPILPLWNRQMSVNAYIPYTSNSLDARPGQPTGDSKICLSCHDGTIALGSVVSRNQSIHMAQGIMNIPRGRSNLGTDLSDDHPISFRYDSSLVALDQNLVSPRQLPADVKLDANQELQCTTCHEVHDNSHGNFLVMDNQDAALCRSCHQISSTTIAAHQDCMNCHQTHTAPSGPYILRSERITETCMDCHDGSHVGAQNLTSQMNRFDVHDTDSPVDPPGNANLHTTCASCHNPHTMETGTAIAPDIHPNFGRVAGMSSSGTPVDAAAFEYEVCYSCHSDQPAVTSPTVSRQIQQTNTRMEFSLSAISFHPVEGPGRSMDVPSLKPSWTTSSVMYCSDCHASENIAGGGNSQRTGVHGSNQTPLLKARYDTSDFTSESSQAYALCYQCHYRDGSDGILSDRSFKEHKMHIVDENTSCSVCHDSHGISSAQGSLLNNSHLINFDTSIVFPDPVTGRLEFQDFGNFTGQCFLSCHGKTHSPEEY